MPNEAKTDDLSAAELAGYIDHTLLKPDATTAAVDRLCAEARQYEFAAVCVNSCHVARVAARLGESPVKICSVVGFPLGAMASSAKACEAKQAVADGAHEIDMVLNVGLLKSGDDPMVLADIRAVREAAPAPAELKVIIETCLLSDAEKKRACRLCRDAGADFVKTSTGFGGGGATTEDVALMREVVGPALGVKASGGIKDYTAAMAMIRAGANRLGVSAGIAIVGNAPR